MARRCVVWGTYDRGKPRVRMLVKALGLIEPDLHVCHKSPWEGIEDKTRLSTLARIGVFLRWLAAYPILILAYLRAPQHDIVVVPYPGNLDVLVLWPFARLRGARICWDMFISIYDTVVIDRAMVQTRGPAAQLIYAAEWLSTRAADLVLLDTAEHARYISTLFHLPEHKTRSVWVGAECDVFKRATFPSPTDFVEVLFYGQFIPLHGLPVIIEAIDLIGRHGEVPPMHFTIIGTGQVQPLIDRMISERRLDNLTRIAWVDYADLTRRIESSSICLGVFAAEGKATRVIPNKVFQILAVGRPLVTMDSPAIREILQPGRAVRLVPPGDAKALAAALAALAQELSDPTATAAIHGAVRAEMIVADVDMIRDQLAKAMERL